MTTVKRDGSEIRFFLLLFLFYRSPIHVQSKNDQAGYTIGRHLSLSESSSSSSPSQNEYGGYPL
jgi:hypothetical protein